MKPRQVTQVQTGEEGGEECGTERAEGASDSQREQSVPRCCLSLGIPGVLWAELPVRYPIFPFFFPEHPGQSLRRDLSFLTELSLMGFALL